MRQEEAKCDVLDVRSLDPVWRKVRRNVGIDGDARLVERDQQRECAYRLGHAGDVHFLRRGLVRLWVVGPRTRVPVGAGTVEHAVAHDRVDVADRLPFHRIADILFEELHVKGDSAGRSLLGSAVLADGDGEQRCLEAAFGRDKVSLDDLQELRPHACGPCQVRDVKRDSFRDFCQPFGDALNALVLRVVGRRRGSQASRSLRQRVENRSEVGRDAITLERVCRGVARPCDMAKLGRLEGRRIGQRTQRDDKLVEDSRVRLWVTSFGWGDGPPARRVQGDCSLSPCQKVSQLALGWRLVCENRAGRSHRGDHDNEDEQPRPEHMFADNARNLHGPVPATAIATVTEIAVAERKCYAPKPAKATEDAWWSIAGWRIYYLSVSVVPVPRSRSLTYARQPP